MVDDVAEQETRLSSWRSAQEPRFPFAAIVGNDEAKTALCLMTVSPHLSGALLCGTSGAGKTTLARSFGGLVPFGAPFAELPQHIVSGNEHVPDELTHRWLAGADGGVLFIDDLAALGRPLRMLVTNGASAGIEPNQWSESTGDAASTQIRFVLVANLAPNQELTGCVTDKFGLSAVVGIPESLEDRAEMLRRHLAFAHDPEGFTREWSSHQAEIRRRLELARPAELSEQLLEPIASIGIHAGCRSGRADLALARAACAYAGWHGRRKVAEGDLAVVATMALRHRLESPDAGAVIRAAVTAVLGGTASPSVPASAPSMPNIVPADDEQRASSTEPTESATAADRDDRDVEALIPDAPPPTSEPAPITRARTQPSAGVLGDAVLRPTAKQTDTPTFGARRTTKPANGGKGPLVVLVVDSSATPGGHERCEIATQAATSLIASAGAEQMHVAVVACAGDGPTVVLHPTASPKIAQSRLGEFPEGGATPLTESIIEGLTIACRPGHHDASLKPVVVFLVAGTLYQGRDHEDDESASLEPAFEAADRVSRRPVQSLVVHWSPTEDSEEGARELAERMGAMYLTPSELTVESLVGTVRSLVHQRRSASV